MNIDETKDLIFRMTEMVDTAISFQDLKECINNVIEMLEEDVELALAQSVCQERQAKREHKATNWR